MSMDASLNEKITQTRGKRLSTIPESAQSVFQRSWAKKASPRQAIKAQCLECMGFDRKGIAGCTSYACSLWEYRPFQNK